MSIYRMKLNYLFGTSHACWRPDIEPVIAYAMDFMHSMCVLVYIYLLFCVVVLSAYLKFPFIFGLSTVSFSPSISRCLVVCVCAPNKILQIKLAIVHISRTHFYQSIEMTKIAWYLASNRSCSIFSSLEHCSKAFIHKNYYAHNSDAHTRSRLHTQHISGGRALTLFFFFELFKVDDVFFTHSLTLSLFLCVGRFQIAITPYLVFRKKDKFTVI